MKAPSLESRVAILEGKVANLEKQLEYNRIISGVKRGLEESRQGCGKPLSRVDQELRAKHNIPLQ